MLPAHHPLAPYQWQKGRAKTGGRKAKTTEERNAQKLAQGYTVEAVAILVEEMRQTEDKRLRHDAAVEMLNRGWGRPPTAVLIGMGGQRSLEDLDLTKVSDGDLELLVAQLERALSGTSGEGPALIEGHAVPAEEVGGSPPDADDEARRDEASV